MKTTTIKTKPFLKSLLIFSLYTLSFSLVPMNAQNITFYGMTTAGGHNGDGNIFEYNSTTNTYTDLIDFSGTSGSYSGNDPRANLIEATDGNLYGMTPYGGTNGFGNIFKYNPTTRAFTDLIDFSGTNGPSVGQTPYGSLMQASNGILYGMTSGSGSYSQNGNIFSYDINTGTYTDLIDFTGTDGANPGGSPEGNLIQASDGYLYGMSTNAGLVGIGNGSIFRYNITTNTLTVLVNFTGYHGAYVGSFPAGSLVQASDGNLYGMTAQGGADFCGNMFQYNPVSGNFVDLFDFTLYSPPYTGNSPTGNLIQGSNGILYGMTGSGGSQGYGNIFSYDYTSSTFTDMIEFDNNPPIEGYRPEGSLIQASDGNLYGMTFAGGENGDIFTTNLTGSTFTELTEFVDSQDSGKYPFGDLLQYFNTTITITSNVTCKGGDNGNLTANAGGGTQPYTYSWSNGTTTVSTSNPTGPVLSAGNYTVLVTDNRGLTATASAIITQPAVGVTISISTQTNIKCNGSSTGSINAHAATLGASPYSYNWTPSGGTNLSATGLSAGTYTITATDHNGCTAIASATLTQPSAIRDSLVSMTGPICNGGDNGSATIGVKGGITPYTYTWSYNVSTTSTATILKAQAYTVTVKDKNACSLAVIFTVTQPLAIRDSIVPASKQNITCNEANNGSATVGAKFGTMPYTYNWTPGGGTNATADNLSVGTYTVHITDANGCTGSTSTSITQPAILRDSMVSADIVNIICNGGSTGSTTVGIKGGSSPYTYAWSPVSGTTSKLTGLWAGTYTVNISDKNGCTVSASINLTQPAALRDSLVIMAGPTCYGGDNGSATIGVKGGTTPYTYIWNPTASTTLTAINLKAEPYTVTVKDKNNCSQAVIFTVTQPLAVSVSILSSTGVLCSGGNTGSATANSASGGTSPYTYNWTPSGGTNLTASGLTAGTYIITAKDVNGCTCTTSVSVTQPGIIRDSMIAADIVNISCNGGSNGSLTAGVKGGTLPYTYSWAPLSGTKSKLTGLTAGTYTIFITDKNECTSTSSFTMTQPAAIRDSVVSLTSPTCNGGDNGMAIIGVKGGTTPYTYIWTSSISTTATATVLKAQTYTVTVKDKNNCSLAVVFTVTQPLAIRDSIIAASKVNESCNGESIGSATAGAKFGTTPYTYNWQPNGGTNATASILSAGTYTVHITDVNGCTAITSTTITQPVMLRDSISTITCSGGNSNATIGVKGGTSPYTYLWMPGGGTNRTMNGLTTGTYTISVNDKNGCTTSFSQSFNCSLAPPERKQDENHYPDCCPAIENVSLFPNPNTGQFTIAGLENGMLIEIYDYTGKRVSNITANNNTMQFNLSNQPNGIYLVRIISNDGKVVSQKKVVKMQ